jgi:antitoxin (DNA-binding transcriptional repressor) of toxin-antitoxin stability system
MKMVTITYHNKLWARLSRITRRRNTWILNNLQIRQSTKEELDCNQVQTRRSLVTKPSNIAK